ncbi:MAG: hypothetical protein CMD08_03020 [Flavobacteriales bacterium]|nr:hypothetical protein [Flavobacteriales bacterium]
MFSKKIIVFGSQGFVGSNIINYYSTKKYKLIGIGRKSKLIKKKNYLKIIIQKFLKMIFLI